jgi:hypothetical protein
MRRVRFLLASRVGAAVVSSAVFVGMVSSPVFALCGVDGVASYGQSVPFVAGSWTVQSGYAHSKSGEPYVDGGDGCAWSVYVYPSVAGVPEELWGQKVQIEQTRVSGLTLWQQTCGGSKNKKGKNSNGKKSVVIDYHFLSDTMSERLGCSLTDDACSAGFTP